MNLSEIKKSPERLWNLYFIIVFIISLAVRVAMQMQNSVLALYIKELNGEASAAGLAMGAFTLSSLILRPFVGNFIDKHGRKWVLIIGTIMLALTTISFNFITSMSLLILMRFVVGIGFAVQSTTIGTMASDVLPEKHMMEGIAYFGLTATLASAVAPAIGIYLIEDFSFSALFIFCFLLLAVCTVGSLLLNYEKKRKIEADKLRQITEDTASEIETLELLNSETELLAQEDVNKIDDCAFEENKPIKWWEKLLEKNSLPIALIQIFLMFPAATVFTFLPLYVSELGIDLKAFGAFFTIQAAATFTSRIFMGKVVKKVGPSKVLIPCFIVTALGYVAYFLFTELAAFFIISIFTGFASGVIMPLFNGVAIKVAPTNRRGAANATFFLAIDFGFGLGSVAWGYVAGWFGYATIFLLSAVVVLIGFILYMLIVNKTLIKLHNEGKL